ncbi:HAD hydrolase family protein, partial [uncultured Anaerococcus sp.]|uniref:HAD hydrolase family protein n=1 Tax=uncultured Anaerococcus sp. TaxID=293428 RepID=UPI0028897216
PARRLFEKFGDRTAQVKSTRFFYEIMPLGLSKGSSILEACKIFGIDKEDVIVFGDEMNDMSMFEVAGTGVAMGNAVDPIKKLAAYVTKSNNEDGIAFYLENFLLNKENK